MLSCSPFLPKENHVLMCSTFKIYFKPKQHTIYCIKKIEEKKKEKKTTTLLFFINTQHIEYTNIY